MSETTDNTPETTGDEFPETGSKRVAEMTIEEKVEFLTQQNRKLEDRLKGKNEDPQKSIPFLTKQRDALAKELEGIKQSQMSEQEKILARAETAEKALESSRLDAMRASVALAKRLTPSQAKRLVGSSLEELEADADELLADLKNTAPAAAASSEGQGKQGEVVGQTKQITSQDALKSMTAQEIVAARKEGRLNELMGVKN